MSTRLLACSLLLLLSSLPALAGWVPLGPDAGRAVSALAADPSDPDRLIAAGVGQPLLTADGGGSWSTPDHGLPPGDLSTLNLLIHPGRPATVLLAVVPERYAFRRTRLYLSDDRGRHWRPVRLDSPPGSPEPSVFTLAVDPATPATLYAGTTRFVHRSEDGGDTWTALSGDLADWESFEVHALAVAPSDPATLYVAGWWRTGDNPPGLLRTSDGGSHWQDLATSEWHTDSPSDLAVDPDDPEVVYFAGAQAGVQKSTDGGLTWAFVNQGLPHLAPPHENDLAPVSRLLVDPVDPDTLYAALATPVVGEVAGTTGVYTSAGGGEHWTATGSGIPAGLGVADLALGASGPGRTGRLWAATERGLFVSEDLGASWEPPEGRLPSSVTAIAPVVRTFGIPAVGIPSRPTLFAGTPDGGAWRRIEAGQWLETNGWSDRGGLSVEDLALAPPENPQRLFLASGLATAAEVPLTDPGVAGLFRTGYFSGPVEGVWDLLGAELSREELDLVVTAIPDGAPPNDPGAVYASAADGLWVSRDRGETWDRLRDAGVESLAFLPTDPDLLVAGTATPRPDVGPGDDRPPVGGIIRSTDGGETWTVGGAGLPSQHFVAAVAIDPRDPARVFAGLAGDPSLTDPASGGLFVSRDGGTSFQRVVGETGPELPQLGVSTILFEPPDSPEDGAVYAGTLGAGVFRSLDRGVTWSPLGAVQGAGTSGVLGDGWVTDLAFDEEGALLAGTRSGIYQWLEDVPGPPPPPEGPWLADPALGSAAGGFRFKVRITSQDGMSRLGAREPVCLPETACVSGAVPGRSEVFVRIVGPKGNGYLWPTLVKFTTSEVEVWVQRPATGELRYYDLAAARPGVDELPGLFDRFGFLPEE